MEEKFESTEVAQMEELPDGRIRMRVRRGERVVVLEQAPDAEALADQPTANVDPVQLSSRVHYRSAEAFKPGAPPMSPRAPVVDVAVDADAAARYLSQAVPDAATLRRFWQDGIKVWEGRAGMRTPRMVRVTDRAGALEHTEEHYYEVEPGPALREALAAYAHEAWAGWMRYLFGHGEANADGTFAIAADKVERWRRQMATAYAALPEAEKASDRAEADKMLRIVESETDR